MVGKREKVRDVGTHIPVGRVEGTVTVDVAAVLEANGAVSKQVKTMMRNART